MQDNTNNMNAGNLTDAQVDQYFESGGQEGILENTDNTEKEVDQVQTKETHNVQEYQPVDDKKSQINEEERNYKAAMVEERERRKELQRQMQESQTRTQQIEQKFQAMVEYLQKQHQQAAPQPPSFDESPLEALRYEQERLKQHMEYVQNIERQRQENEVAQQKESAFMNQYRNDALSFAKQSPDFSEAYSNLMQSRFHELKAAGYSDQQAQSLMIEDEKMIVLKAYQDQVNPAERLYNLAQVRGYKPKTALRQDTNIQNIQKAQEASMSLSNVGASSPGQKRGVTLEDLVNMDIDDFDKNWDKVMKKLT